ncbi:MAG: hypothetical protein SWH78_17685, partial [Thermodesulfobacteriota bacterium]|nr:hypothetical protein [Thermodesulfobacteriota bacterium]
ATLALNSALYLLRFLPIVISFPLGVTQSLAHCPVFGDHRLNLRLSIQQGTFLCPCNINYSFMANFCASISKNTPLNNHVKLLEIKPKLRKKVLKELYRMNITKASLFPGLTGFAESLKHSLLLPGSVSSYTKKRKALLYSQCED